MRWVFVLCAGLSVPANAESVVATRTIRAQTVLTQQDMTLVAAEIPGAVDQLDGAIGLEARVTLYAGRAILASSIGPPALIERNQIVVLSYTAGGLGILTDGRALARGGVGDVIRVMNLASRNIIAGQILADGTVAVGPNSAP